MDLTMYEPQSAEEAFERNLSARLEQSKLHHTPLHDAIKPFVRHAYNLSRLYAIMKSCQIENPIESLTSLGVNTIELKINKVKLFIGLTQAIWETRHAKDKAGFIAKLLGRKKCCR